ncbi:hypothetical protein [Haematobacter missouriensis]|uniref:hypothetical protein n=1 Tax=Haematobacter missouriensis TaxID=366616 RepID=UPI00117BA42B|nr:hypothetical protein [Haematobacter missouriensis]
MTLRHSPGKVAATARRDNRPTGPVTDRALGLLARIVVNRLCREAPSAPHIGDLRRKTRNRGDAMNTTLG